MNDNVDISGNFRVFGETLFKDLETQDLYTRGNFDVEMDVSMGSKLRVTDDVTLLKNVDILDRYAASIHVIKTANKMYKFVFLLAVKVIAAKSTYINTCKSLSSRFEKFWSKL